jgi:hypothetical protein
MSIANLRRLLRPVMTEPMVCVQVIPICVNIGRRGIVEEENRYLLHVQGDHSLVDSLDS